VEIDPEDISVSFDDVKGCDEAKQELKEVVEFLKNPEKFSNLGGKLPKGVLLVVSFFYLSIFLTKGPCTYYVTSINLNPTYFCFKKITLKLLF